MKTWLILSLLWLVALGSQAANYDTGTFTASLTKPAVAGHSYYYQMVNESGTVLSSGPLSSFSNSSTGSTATVQGFTHSQKFRLMLGSRTTTTGIFTPQKWVNSYLRGGPVNQSNTPSGDFDANGNPLGPNGYPVDFDGIEATPPPELYEWSTTFFSDSGTSVYTVTIRKSQGNTIQSITSYSVAEGSEKFVKVRLPYAFRVTVKKKYWDTINEREREDVYDQDASGRPYDEGEPEIDPDAPPNIEQGPTSPIGSEGPGTGGGGNSTTTVTPVPDAPNVTRPGNAEGNADARAQELRGEMRRIVDQLVKNGQISLDQATDLLVEMRDGKVSTVEGLRDVVGAVEGVEDAIRDGNGEGGEGGDGGGTLTGDPGATGSISGAVGYADAEKEETRDPSNAAGAQSIMTAGSDLVSAMGGLLGALNLSSPGTGTLSWTISMPGNFGGTRTISLETWSSAISAVRGFLLLLAGVYFAKEIIATVRGAFA